jgi:hypothetical protein
LHHIPQGFGSNEFGPADRAKGIFSLGLVIDNGVPTLGAHHRGHPVFFDINKVTAAALNDMIGEEAIVGFKVLSTIGALDDKFCHVWFLLSFLLFLCFRIRDHRIIESEVKTHRDNFVSSPAGFFGNLIDSFNQVDRNPSRNHE